MFNGLLIDRYGPVRVSLWAAVIGFAGAVLTAIGTPYALMWTGRLIFGVSEGAIFISLLASVARWFPRSGIALASARSGRVARGRAGSLLGAAEPEAAPGRAQAVATAVGRAIWIGLSRYCPAILG